MKLLLYCTKAKPYLYSFMDRLWEQNKKLAEEISMLNGKVVAECDFEVSNIESHQSFYNYGLVYYTTRKEPFRYFSYTDLLEASCLQDNECCKYLGSKGGYAIHIKNLHIFNKPKELNEYCYIKEKPKGVFNINTLKNAPQNMMYVCNENEYGKEYVLISIQPQWLCKILNSEKTVEVRKKILKEMKNDK